MIGTQQDDGKQGGQQDDGHTSEWLKTRWATRWWAHNRMMENKMDNKTMGTQKDDGKQDGQQDDGQTTG